MTSYLTPEQKMEAIRKASAVIAKSKKPEKGENEKGGEKKEKNDDKDND